MSDVTIQRIICDKIGRRYHRAQVPMETDRQAHRQAQSQSEIKKTKVQSLVAYRQHTKQDEMCQKLILEELQLEMCHRKREQE
jgi:hypothetical protein